MVSPVKIEAVARAVARAVAEAVAEAVAKAVAVVAGKFGVKVAWRVLARKVMIRVTTGIMSIIDFIINVKSAIVLLETG